MTDPAIDLCLEEGAEGRPILDAACLPDGAAIVALGEAGSAIYREGAVVARLRSPAHHLAIAEDGSQAIAIGQAPEDDRCWLTKIDIGRGTESPWCDIARYRTNRYARTFDGRRWYIAFERHICEINVLAVDVTARDFRVDRDVEETGMLVAMEQTADRLWVEATSIGAAHFTLYSLPALRIVSRGDIVSPRIRFPPRPGQPFEIMAGSVHPPASTEPVFAVGGPMCTEPRLMGALKWTAPLPGNPLGPSALKASGPWIAAAVEEEGGCQALAMDLRSRSFEGRVRFPGATSAGVNLRGEMLIAWDNRGRMAVIDLARRAVVQTAEVAAWAR